MLLDLRFLLIKIITVPFEPGSIVKAFTVGIGLDADELRFEDKYQDD